MQPKPSLIITTFSPEGYIEYGKRFIKTWRLYCRIPLVIYIEDDLRLEGISVRRLYDVKDCRKFLDTIGEFKEAKYKHLKNYYRWNANKFCRKVFAITDACQKHDGYVIFLGGDCVFLKDMPDRFFSGMMEGVYISYLGRRGFHSETDFLCFDTTYQINDMFMRLFIREYTTGAYQGLEHYCDSDVFDHIRLLLMPPTNNINLTDELFHPFVNSVLGKYIDHLKGDDRKKHGKSFDADYKKRIIPFK